MNSFRLLLTAVVLAIAITAVFISTALQAQEGQEDDVFINTPTSTDIYHLFPRGSNAVLSFGTAIATGPVGTTITYSIEYELDGTVTPLPDLFLTEVVDETDGTITYSKSATPTIEQYRTAYGTTGDEAIINATITATDGTTTDTLDFDIHIQHDQSAQTDSPAVYQSYNRWKIPTLYEVYEGPNAVASFNWSASHSDTAVDRRWSMAEEPDGQQATVSCNYDGATIDEVHINWPNTDHDSYLFNPVNETTDPPSHPSGTVTVSFDNSNPDPEVGDTPLKYPDFENPHDHDDRQHLPPARHQRQRRRHGFNCRLQRLRHRHHGQNQRRRCTQPANQHHWKFQRRRQRDKPLLDSPDHIRRQRHHRRLPAFVFQSVQIPCPVPR